MIVDLATGTYVGEVSHAVAFYWINGRYPVLVMAWTSKPMVS